MSPALVRTPAVQHRPFGIEHPYATSADQRVPVLPADGERVRLGVVAAPDVVAVTCEWDSGEGAAERLALAPASTSAADAAALAGGDGHLAEAQAAQLESDGAWSVTSPPVRAGEAVRYRFVSQTKDGDSEVTAWFSVSAGTWSGDGGLLTVGGVPACAHPRVVPGSVAWLRDADGLQRVRFALRLADAEHVVGFGERFDAVDQRGRRLDAVVFEQYKSQGAHGRTYLPMPFAHVVGGDGWGFHVRTSRRTWFDVGASAPDRLVV
ncbi:MAG TPA: hypothetical protein VGK35_05350, partial [Actinotalea sp.]